MNQAIRWSRSIGFRLGGSALALFAAAMLLIGMNLWLLSGLHGAEEWTARLVEGAVLRYRTLDLAERIFDAPAERAQTKVELVAAMTALDDRYRLLLEGDPAAGVAPLRDPRVVHSLREREGLWKNELRPLLARVMAAATREQAQADLDRYRDVHQQYLGQLDRDVSVASEITTGRVRQFLILQVVFAGLVIAVRAVVLWVTRGIALRVRSLAGAADRVAEGDLLVKAAVPGRDEVAVLGRSFDVMTARLRAGIEKDQAMRAQLETLLEAVRETATRLATGTNQIVTSTNQQAAGAQEQAGAVPETVAG